MIAHKDALIAAKDSMLAVAHARIDALSDSTQTLTVQMAVLQNQVDSLSAVIKSADKITQVHLLGWGVTLLGFLIAAGIAFLGWRATANTSRKAVEGRRLIEERWRRERLIERIRATLDWARSIANSTVKKDHTHAINPETVHGLVIEWERYDRLSDDLSLLADPDLQRDVDALLGYVRMIGEKTVDAELRFSATRDKLGEVTRKGLILDPSVEAGVQAKRKELLDLIKDMIAKVERTLARFNSKFPPTGVQVERRTPEDPP